MLLISAAVMTLAKTQLTMAHFSRQTSNSYHLACSGAEKIVDSMNKELVAQLPRLMMEASKITQRALLATDHHFDGAIYVVEKDADPYGGKYRASDLNGDYEVKLKQLIYQHITQSFIKEVNEKKTMDYQVYSDVKGNEPIEVTTRIYYKDSLKIPEELREVANDLITLDQVGRLDKGVFLASVTARAKDDIKTSLTRSTVVATIALDLSGEKDEHLLEEYEWATGETTKAAYLGVLQMGTHIFEDIRDQIDLAVFNGEHQWSYNNPVHILEGSKSIDLSKLQEVPTAIVCLDPDATLTFIGGKVFNGIMITPGQVVFENETIINGVVIAGNEPINAQINYEKDTLLKIRCIDKSLQRKLYDCLKFTNYKNLGNKQLAQVEAKKTKQTKQINQEIMNTIMGKQDDRIITLGPLSVMSSQHSGHQFTLRSLRKNRTRTGR